MRLFVYEYVTAVNPGQGTNGSLGVEGWAMLSAIVEDFSRLAGIQVMTLVGAGLDRHLGHRCRRIRAEEEEDAFKDLAATADYALIIAPEFCGLLARRCRWVLDVGGRLLGPAPDAVALAADKLALADHFQQRSIPTPATIRLSESVTHSGLSCRPELCPAVCKPRYGAGSQATFLVQSLDELPRVRELAAQEMPGEEMILQPFVVGQSASVAFLIGSGRMRPLIPATQQLSADGRFHYRGGRAPLPPAQCERAVRLARRALEAVPGLMGYIGVDLVLGPSAGGADDCVIEVNPRLTTSYLGLRRLARGNLAEAMLGIGAGANVPDLEWHPGYVRFQNDGTVEYYE